MTMPNRAFALAATSQGHMDDHVKTFTCASIFGRLSDAGLDWAIFGYNRDPLTRHDFPDIQDADEAHFGHFRDFQQRCAAGSLPAFTFLEPAWQASGNSQHPNYDVAAGEQLIKDAYDAVRLGPAWPKTLFIVTYDEHGGCYDHVAPPLTASPPNDGAIGEFGFDFTRFGVRVPAVLISPLIAPGTVFRAAEGVIDHTSVLKTISERFDTAPLTDRDRAAPSLAGVLTLAEPRADDPLAGVLAPVSGVNHPSAAAPSHLDLVQAAKVAALPVRNDHGFYEEATPDVSTAGHLGDFIRDRHAAWSQHMQRQRRRAAHGGSAAIDKQPADRTPTRRRTSRKTRTSRPAD